MRYQTVLVDPKKAELWLKKNTKNRKVSNRHVSQLANEMKEGKWLLNGQAIAFSKDGVLLDGQHRLLAVIMSGVTVEMTVAFGVDHPDAFKTYDVISLKRGVAQVASMMGVDTYDDHSTPFR